MNLTNKRNADKFSKILFILLTVFYSFIMFVLFYRQCVEYQGVYYSDMKAYILEAQGLDSGYSFPYPLMFWVAKVFMVICNPELAMAVAVTVLNSLSLILLKYYMDRFTKDMLVNEGRVWSVGWDMLVSVLAVSLLFVSMVYVPRGHGFFGFDYIYRCNGSYTPNPFWNATYLATRPFSIVCFFSGVRLLGSYEKQTDCRIVADTDKKDYLIFMLSLFLTTITKPSYTLVAVVTFAVIMLYRFVRSRFGNFKQSIWFGLTFIPAGCALLYQYFGVFTGTNSMGEETGMGIEIAKAWSIYSDNIPLSVFMAAAFPLGVLVINLPRLKDTDWFKHGWQIWLTGFLMFLFLYEKGFRLPHVNFSWGYMHGLFFIFTVSVLMLLRNTVAKKGKIRTAMVAAGWLGYLWHLGCGIVYFLYVYSGQNSGWF